MEIKKENESIKVVHKKQDGTLHKKAESKISKKNVATRTKGGIKYAGSLAKNSITSNVEGGENIDNALYATKVISKPVTKVAKKSSEKIGRIRKASKYKKTISKSANGRIRTQMGNRAKNIAKKRTKNVAKKSTKKATKEITKETTRIATKVGTTVAGSVAGPEGTLIGMAAGEVVDLKYLKMQKSNRKFKFLMDKLKPQNKQNDSITKLIIDLVKTNASFLIKKAITYILPALLPIILIIMIAITAVLSVVAVLYNSPLALFLPPLSSEETIQSVTSDYVSSFNAEINDLVTKHEGGDEGRIIYVDYEGMSNTPSNYYDIMSVYMIKYGYGSTAIEMSEQNKTNLKTVFDDMCSYTTTVTSKKVKVDGKKKTVKYLDVNVTLKTYTQMETEYQFEPQKVELLESMMGNNKSTSSGGSTMTDAKSSLSDDEIKGMTDKIKDPVQKSVVGFALAKVGYPYSQPKRDSGQYFDCSSLAYYAWKNAGVDISYNGGTTAAAEGQGCAKNGIKVTADKLQPGDLIFYSYTQNNRYKNISHVGIYIGNGKMVEAVDEATGVVICNYHDANMVMIGRPKK